LFDRLPGTNYTILNYNSNTMDKEMYKLAIGELLKDADPDSHRIISAYKYDVTYKKNLSALTASCHTAIALEICANYMKIETRNPGKVYSNKKKLADRIILKIEATFTETCDECQLEYRNKRDDEIPPFTCFLCWQGSHNCTALIEKTTELDKITGDRPLGLLWTCRGCRTKNDLIPQAKATNTTDAKGETPQEQLPSEEAETEKEDDEEERHSPRRNQDVETSRNEATICELYKRHKCPHGLTGKREIGGKPCPNNHPKRCFKYCKFGEKHRHGCNKRKNCDYYHPVLCKYSVRNRICTNLDCTYTHLQGTKRHNPDDVPDTSKRETKDTKNAIGNTKGILKLPHLQYLQGGRDRSESICSNISWKDTRTPMYPLLNKNKPLPRPRRNSNNSNARNEITDTTADQISFLVKLVEDLKGTQEDFRQEISELQQQMFTSHQHTQPVQQGQPTIPPFPNAQHLGHLQHLMMNQPFMPNMNMQPINMNPWSKQAPTAPSYF
jgi:hypothetical protein